MGAPALRQLQAYSDKDHVVVLESSPAAPSNRDRGDNRESIPKLGYWLAVGRYFRPVSSVRGQDHLVRLIAD